MFVKKWEIQYRNTGCNVIRTVRLNLNDSFEKRDVQKWFNSNNMSLKMQSLKHLGFAENVFGHYRIKDFVNCKFLNETK